MAPLPGSPCRVVAPLLARADDPDLTEAERVLLSTHLVRCPTCLARLQEYRAQDRALRRWPALTPAPELRHAVFSRLAAPRATHPHSVGPMPAVAAVAMLACVTVALGLGGLLGSSPPGTPTVAATRLSSVVAVASVASAPALAVGEGLSAPFAVSLLAVGPTPPAIVARREAANVAARAPVIAAIPQSTIVNGIVRSVAPAEGLIVVILPSGSDAYLTLARDAMILLPDGRPGTLANLGVGATIRARCDQAPGGTLAREITVLR